MYLTDLNESARAKLAEVQALGYTVGENGLIADPGKFESEPFATPLLWQIGLEGFADTDESGVYEFEMSPTELADYGLDYGFGTKPLNGKTFYVQLSESDQGFVTLYMSQQSIAEMNGDYDDSDDPNNMESWYESLGARYAPELDYIYPLPFDESAYLAARAAYDAGTHDNNMTSAIELYEWKRDKPDSYFLYIDEKSQRATTWTGDTLGRVVFSGSPYYTGKRKNMFRSKRQSITVYGTNGVTYYGTYFVSSGDYARIRAYKNQSR